jgi:hypothetical protein
MQGTHCRGRGLEQKVSNGLWRTVHRASLGRLVLGAHSRDGDTGAEAAAQREGMKLTCMTAWAYGHDDVLAEGGDGSRPGNLDFLKLMRHSRIVAGCTD